MDIKEAATLLGRKGGLKNKAKGSRYFKQLQEKSGASRRARREIMLSSVTLGDLENTAILSSVIQGLEKIDSES